MYLSRIRMDDARRETMRALALPNLLHGAIEQSFPGERRRRLWRVDRFQDSCDLMILSEEKPSFTELCKQFCAEPIWESRDYAPLLSRIEDGQLWQFRLCANPVHSMSPGPNQRGHVFAHVTQEQQRQWLMERAEKHGFQVAADAFDVIDSRWYQFHKGKGHTVTLRTATFEGLLTVQNTDSLREALLTGIGREKAYGCGMLTLMRPHGKNHD